MDIKTSVYVIKMIFKSSSVRKFSQEWLKQAIHYGDIGKILEPLLLTMLNPTSQRISIHYASLWKSSMSPVDVANGECIVSARDSGREHDLNSSDSENDLNDSGMIIFLNRLIQIRRKRCKKSCWRDSLYLERWL